MDSRQEQGILEEVTDGDDPLAALMAEVRSDTDKAHAEAGDVLDDLLAESMAEVKEAQAVKNARERLKRGEVSDKERQAGEERIRRWELANEWRPVANVALFERYKCACGRQQTIFRQLMQRQEHRHMRGTQRWQQVEAGKADLPNEVAVQKWNTPMCTECSPRAGFTFGAGRVTEWRA